MGHQHPRMSVQRNWEGKTSEVGGKVARNGLMEAKKVESIFFKI